MPKEQPTLNPAPACKINDNITSPDLQPYSGPWPKLDNMVLAAPTDLFLAGPEESSDNINKVIKLVNQTFPAILKVAQPKPAPATPGKPFTPPVPQITGVNTPVIAEWTRTANPTDL